MIRYVKIEDIENCLSMMELVKEDFAGYKEKAFLKELHKAIENEEAILDEREGNITGMISFSYADKELSFLAVHPDYRKNGIAKTLISKMQSCFPKGEEIHVITFREGDLKGRAARKCYHSCGFVDVEELEVFDYPCQKMICVI